MTDRDSDGVAGDAGAVRTGPFDAYGLFLDYQRAHPEMRRGQCAFNAIHGALPAAAERFRGQMQDPFHDDRRIEPFLCGVQGLVSYYGMDPSAWPPYTSRDGDVSTPSPSGLPPDLRCP